MANLTPEEQRLREVAEATMTHNGTEPVTREATNCLELFAKGILKLAGSLAAERERAEKAERERSEWQNCYAASEKQVEELQRRNACYNDPRAIDDLLSMQASERLAREAAEKRAAELEKESKWVRVKLGIPEDTPFSSGDGETLCGTMHVVCSHAHGYDTYIVSNKCNDKQGEIARQAVRIAELEIENARLESQSVLAKVREAHKRYDESGLIGGPGDCYLYDWLTDILSESDAGGA